MKTERPDGPSTSRPAVLHWPRTRSRRAIVAGAILLVGVVAITLALWPTGGTRYPKHTGVVATTFWVGESSIPHASDGSQAVSTYDSDWLASYGGCDGRPPVWLLRDRAAIGGQRVLSPADDPARESVLPGSAVR